LACAVDRRGDGGGGRASEAEAHPGHEARDVKDVGAAAHLGSMCQPGVLAQKQCR